MEGKSADVLEEKIARLAEIFPECMTEIRGADGKLKRGIKFDVLKSILSGTVSDEHEAYDFTWVGKNAARAEAYRRIEKTLRPCVKESVDWDTTHNLYIEGDNLDVLKLLQKSYMGKVKMIYIDPPYNTGRDFIYRDRFEMDAEDYAEGIDLFDEGGNKNFVENAESNPRFHSDWCSMIYARLLLARNLLTDDGVIFISIDDNEQANLKKICDNVFGAENFIGTYIKQSKIGGGSDSKFLVKEHEYCIVYAYDVYSTQEMFMSHDENYLKRYKERDEVGRYFWDTYSRPGLQLKAEDSLNYPITCPDGTTIQTRWRRSKDRFEKDLRDGVVRLIQKNDGTWSVQFKQYLNDSGKKPRSMTTDFGGSQDGKTDLKNLFGTDRYFNYPKSVKFISTLISTVTDKDSIVMDFFSGSATTAHAVMALNAEDGGNRRFIMVQLPEKCDPKSEAYKAGYKNICEIGKERIRRAGVNIKSAAPFATTDLDIGFRVLKLDDTNFRDVFIPVDELTQDDLADCEENIKPDRVALDLLFGCLLDWGVQLDMPYTSEQFDGATIHDYADGALIACFDANISRSVVEHMAKKKALRAVFRDAGFDGDAAKLNALELFKLYSPDTSVKVI